MVILKIKIQRELKIIIYTILNNKQNKITHQTSQTKLEILTQTTNMVYSWTASQLLITIGIKHPLLHQHEGKMPFIQ